MEELIISKRYAKAVVQSTDDIKQAWKLYALLCEIMGILHQDERLGQLFELPELDEEAKTHLMEKIAVKNLPLLLKRMLDKMIARGRLAVLPFIIEYLEKEICKREGIQLVIVKTAYKLEKSFINEMTEILKEKFGKGIRLKNVVDERLLGGVRLEFDDKVIDGTIRGELTKLREVLVGV